MDQMMEAMGYKREFEFTPRETYMNVYSPNSGEERLFPRDKPHALRKWLTEQGADEETIAAAMRLLDTGGKE